MAREKISIELEGTSRAELWHHLSVLVGLGEAYRKGHGGEYPGLVQLTGVGQIRCEAVRTVLKEIYCSECCGKGSLTSLEPDGRPGTETECLICGGAGKFKAEMEATEAEAGEFQLL